jgi:hypothetical protein
MWYGSYSFLPSLYQIAGPKNWIFNKRMLIHKIQQKYILSKWYQDSETGKEE